ncbi:MAG: hypothetical protein ACOYNA_08660, partial [Burkholderiaceae bacterium]
MHFFLQNLFHGQHGQPAGSKGRTESVKRTTTGKRWGVPESALAPRQREAWKPDRKEGEEDSPQT